MAPRRKLTCCVLMVFACLMLYGCGASFLPVPMEQVRFTDRVQTQSDEYYQVKTSVLSAKETNAVFGHPLYEKGIQPVWIEITNKDTEPVWFLPFSLDPDYFPPLEVAYYYHRSFQGEYNDDLDQFFLARQMGLFIAPGDTRSGFVFTNLDLGTKIFNLDLVGRDKEPHTFTFFIPVPGLRADHEDVEFQELYTADQLVDLDLEGFKRAIGEIPCTTMDAENSGMGLPVNLIIVSEGRDLLRNLIRSGWNETASTNESSSTPSPAKVDRAQASRYETVTPLRYYDRQQDASFRKSRSGKLGGSILRLWLSPIKVEGKSVWIGQVSRDTEPPKLSYKNHVLDIDEDRALFLQKLWYFQGLEKYGYLDGDCASTIADMKQITKKNAYLSDGYRLILWMSGKPVPMGGVEVLDWEIPPAE